MTIGVDYNELHIISHTHMYSMYNCIIFQSNHLDWVGWILSNTRIQTLQFLQHMTSF